MEINCDGNKLSYGVFVKALYYPPPPTPSVRAIDSNAESFEINVFLV
jgi:hypothetical protein